MGRLGAHPHIVTVFDIGEEDGPALPGQRAAWAAATSKALIAQAPEHRLPLADTLAHRRPGLPGARPRARAGHRPPRPQAGQRLADRRRHRQDRRLRPGGGARPLAAEQAGMMVGTVAYMPPEQALGGEVGRPQRPLLARRDALRAGTGRPPFLGDDPVAIISQHLNTPPVAPSWHNPDCPPPLEALILRLLAKDPAERPASAAAVRAGAGRHRVHQRRAPTRADEPPGAAEREPARPARRRRLRRPRARAGRSCAPPSTTRSPAGPAS